ncbi:MAG: hypothetical protein A3I32_01475 [Candidatus Yanofskybacteria bacterium RIFCSPLOWO2_02_FULL_45_10]|uniref:DOD-type homing endonuclease domain-containing protein n=2 Tax=Candidatus Yanofskyibacteriota TaxID=1752733 RepID=A0A1F8G162_9BACT|nr:MAG: hypothetical protein A3F25_03070 [Candidatus Yanofskybacteria bacterium RIFCSPHIGHO2_12_FULL_45_19b]OGN32968.1 MAG: hypothetical protein A3I32_01475 [Candidatus Yanofskybacteria bacterium RIFCSPLOWO2_02_FULL_45_10]
MVLYRKYRPQTFAEVVGQEHVVDTLRGAIKSNAVAHGYLFTGSRGSGKTTLARLLAKAVNCTNLSKTSYDVCGKCDSCKEIEEGRSLDLIEIDAASNRGIDEIRAVRDSAQVSPFGNGWKTFVIDECLTADHLITMADGTVMAISDIKNGDLVSSIDLEKGKVVSRKVSNFFQRYTDELIKIKGSQATLTCTPTHKLWVLRSGTFQLLKAVEITRSDFLISPVQLPHLSQNNLQPDQLTLLAIIQCDGHVSKDSNTIQVEISKDRNYFIRQIRAGVKAWGVSARPVITRTKRGTTLIRIYSQELKQRLLSLGCPAGKKSALIDIPDQVFEAPLSSIKNYIDAAFCCEGDASRTKSNRLFKLSFTSVSKQFALKLQLLLKKFGIATSLMTIERELANHSTVYRINITGYDLRLFQEIIGLSMARKARVLKGQLTTKLKTDTMPFQSILLDLREKLNIKHSILNKSGVFLGADQNLTRDSFSSFINLAGLGGEFGKFLNFRYEKINELTYIKEKTPVYDFTVADTHTFIVNGICSSNCHMLTKEAFNALLKTLEEPPAKTLFVLATTEPQRVPATIMSRVQRFDFKKLTVAQIAGKLAMIAKAEKIKISPEAIRQVALMAEGALRDAESALGKLIDFCGNEIEDESLGEVLGIISLGVVGEFLSFLVNREGDRATLLVNRLHDSGVDLDHFGKNALEYCRYILSVRANPNSLPALGQNIGEAHAQQVATLAGQADSKMILRIITALLRAQQEMKISPIPQLPLEIAIMELTGG